MKKHIYPIVFSLALTGCVTYSLLDAFVIPHKLEGEYIVSKYIQTDSNTDTDYDVAVTETKKYIVYETVRINNTDVHVAHIYCSAADLKTALAKDTYGLNITEKTSSMASEANAIIAINGDYYGAKKSGYVIKNGILYRSTLRTDTSNDDLVIYADGRFEIINEKDISAKDLLDQGVIQLFAFGPALVNDSSIYVSESAEVSKAMQDNPRTAIGMVDIGHYVFVVSDGRTNQNEGLSLYELAQFMQSQGCKVAYNLDGGGSSTMIYNNEVVNNPTTSGNKISERAVSDIVYITF